MQSLHPHHRLFSLSAPGKSIPKRGQPKRLRRLVCMRPEKRPQTIMEQYRYREMMRQPHNASLWSQKLNTLYEMQRYLRET
jgi:hypothetical protein